jgi:hypothetical protein
MIRSKATLLYRISRLEDSDMLRLNQAMIVVLGLASPGARRRG